MRLYILSFFIVLVSFTKESLFAQGDARLDALKRKYTNEQLSPDERLPAFRDYILATLYERTDEALPDLQEYLQLSLQFKDYVRVAHAYHCLGYYYRKQKDFVQAEKATNEQLYFARLANNSYYVANALVDVGGNEEEKGDYRKALLHYKQALDTAVAAGEPVIEARARINKGNIHKLVGDYYEAIAELQQALELCEKKRITGFMASVLFNLGDINSSIQENEKAEYYYLEAIKWSKKKSNNNTLTLTLQALIRLKLKQKKYEETRKLIDELALVDQMLGIPKNEAVTYGLLAKLEWEENNLDTALFQGQKAYDLIRNLDSKPEMAEIIGVLGLIYLSQDQADFAVKYCERAYQLNVENGSIHLQRENCDCLYKAYKKLNKQARALKHLEIYTDLEERIRNTEQVKRLVKAQLNNDFKRQEEIDSIEIDNRLKLIGVGHERDLKIRMQFIVFVTILAIIMAVSIFYLSRAYRRSKKQKLLLERMDKLNKYIFSIISHDFNGPLLTMNALAKSLEDRELSPEEMHAFTQDIQQQVVRTKDILTNLLNWARSELDIDLSESRLCKVKQVSDELLMHFSEQLIHKELKFKNELPSDLELTIHPDLLRIVLRNMISNSIKYSYHGDEIHLYYVKERKQIVLEDEGVGLRPEQLQQLFSKPMYSSLGTSQEMGFGIGLYITSELLRKISWDIKVESSGPDLGSKISIYHP
ncbi:MAG: tetratricopeptide repeat protein [Bacteroidetes bacterium]|nr:MAG: tetratricopeptide repeat protein [Bacteroidota bacterium]